ncbi:Cytochrome P450 71B23 [Trichinella spiralis]
MNDSLKIRMRRPNNEVQCCDEQSTAVAYFEVGLLSLSSFFSCGISRFSAKFSEIEERILRKVSIDLISV